MPASCCSYGEDLGLMRAIEMITGVYTGNDMNTKYSSSMLFGEECAGEQWTSDYNNVWITKTHYPIDPCSGLAEAEKFTANRCVSIVRNPIDLIAEYADQFLTQTRT